MKMKILAAFALIVAASAVDSRPVITLDLASEMASKAQICEYKQEWLAMVCGTAPGDPSCSSTNGVRAGVPEERLATVYRRLRFTMEVRATECR